MRAKPLRFAEKREMERNRSPPPVIPLQEVFAARATRYDGNGNGRPVQYRIIVPSNPVDERRSAYKPDYYKPVD